MICGKRKLGPSARKRRKTDKVPNAEPMGRIWNPLHGSSNQDHSLFGLGLPENVFR